MANHCGSCEHTTPNPQAFDEVFCWGAPPRLLPAPGPQPGSIVFHPMPEPLVKRSRRACGLFKAKTLEAVANDLEPANAAVQE